MENTVEQTHTFKKQPIDVDSAHLSATYLPEKETVIVTATNSFIPGPSFKQAFNSLGDFIKTNSVKKLIFDKRELKTFHQPSMTWYHVEWKNEMSDYGLKTHRKILPKDELFVNSVQIGRQKIVEDNPDFDINKFDIQYFETIEECIEN